jgi:Family of unknown function (DUF5329)
MDFHGQSDFRNTMNYNYFFIAWIFLLLVGCSNPSTHKESAKAELKIPAEGFEFRLFQRTGTEIPSDFGGVYCHIDDITHGQTYLDIKYSGTVVLQKSIHKGESFKFQINSVDYSIQCTDLINQLVGEDFGYFTIKKAMVENNSKSTAIESTANSTADEMKKIEWLINRIQNANITFIRNGSDHSPQEAADHLRSKLRQAGDQIKTLNDFIENIASKSSMSGSPYQVRMPDGSLINAKDWYAQELKEYK